MPPTPPHPNEDGGAIANVGQDQKIVINSNHPLYLHPSDTPGLSLVFVQLTEWDNYLVWSREMLVALLAKNKLGFINGSCKWEELDPSMHHLWDKCNAFVFTWIMNVISREFLTTIIYSTSAYLVCKDLNEKFNKIGSRIFSLHREISFTTQGLDSITIYFETLKLVWDEFAAICNLPSCNCEEFKTHISHQNNIKLFQFLMGLNESYNNARSNLLMRIPLPTLYEAYSVLSEEERQRGLSGIISSSNTTKTTSSETASYSYENQMRPKQVEQGLEGSGFASIITRKGITKISIGTYIPNCATWDNLHKTPTTTTIKRTMPSTILIQLLYRTHFKDQAMEIHPPLEIHQQLECWMSNKQLLHLMCSCKHGRYSYTM